MKTLLLACDFPPLGGGIARCLFEIASHHEADSLLVSTGARSDGLGDGFSFPVDRIPVRPTRLRTLPGLVRWARRLDRLIPQWNPGFQWVGNIKPAGYPARWGWRRHGVPYGLMLYGHDVLALERQVAQSPFKRAVARRLARDAAGAVAISRWTADRWRAALERLDIDAGRAQVEVVPLGADPGRFRPAVSTDALRARYGLPPGRYLLTVARLEPHKGIDTAIRALAALGPRYQDVHYLIAGVGPDAQRLRDLAERERVGDRVHQLAVVPEAELPALYNLASLYLGLSRQVGDQVEGFGLSLIEASACAKPVIGGRSGGIPDTVREGETGRLVDPADVQAVAAAAARLLDDPDQAAALGAGGRKAVERYFNWQRVAGDLRDVALAWSRGRKPRADRIGGAVADARPVDR